MAQTARLKVEIIGDSKGATTATKEAAGGFKGMAGSILTTASGVSAALGASQIVQWATDFGEASIAAAEDAKRADKILRNAFVGVGLGDKAYREAVKFADAHKLTWGVDDETIKGVQAVLITFDGINKAGADTKHRLAEATQAAFDLAARGFGTAESNAKAIGKALDDPAKALGKLQRIGVTLNAAQKARLESALATNDTLGAQAVILDAVAGKAQGAAAASATSGDKLKVQWQEFQEQIGTALLPILEKLAPVAIQVLGVMAEAVGPVMDVVGFLIDHWQILVDLLFGPLMAVIALVASNWSTVSDAATTALKWITDRFNELVDFLSGVVDTIVGIWNTLYDIFIDPIVRAVSFVVTKVGDIIGAVSHVVDQVGDLVAGIFDTITAPFRDAIDFINDHIWGPFARAWNNIELKIPEVDLGPLGSIGGGTIGLPNLPTHLAGGGIVLGPTLALIGERGPEAVIPLGGRTLGTNVTINVTTTGLGADSPEIQRAVVNALRGYSRRNGPLDIPVRSF